MRTNGDNNNRRVDLNAAQQAANIARIRNGATDGNQPTTGSKKAAHYGSTSPSDNLIAAGLLNVQKQLSQINSLQEVAKKAVEDAKITGEQGKAFETLFNGLDSLVRAGKVDEAKAVLAKFKKENAADLKELKAGIETLNTDLVQLAKVQAEQVAKRRVMENSKEIEFHNDYIPLPNITMDTIEQQLNNN